MFAKMPSLISKAHFFCLEIFLNTISDCLRKKAYLKVAESLRLRKSVALFKRHCQHRM